MNNYREYIRKIIEKSVYVSATEEDFTHTGVMKESGWLMDFRRVIFHRETLEAVAKAFWETFKDKGAIQVCGLEIAAVPLVTGISLNQPESFDKKMSAFFMRKSRKKDALMRMIEGTPASKEVPVVLVDDILNSGKTFIRQIEVLEELGYTISAVWSILRFRDKDFYEYFEEKGIDIYSLFELNDFKESLGTQNFGPRTFSPLSMPFKIVWKFASKDPNYFYVVPKSDPAIDNERVYVGSDSGWFWAINQNDGSTAWNFKVGLHAKGKSIFSSPVVHNNTVFFGAYDGNFYALDAKTGKRKWIFWEADTIGSSPAIAPELGLVFIGLEFGLIRKRGGVAALDVKTGKKKWEFPMAAYTHSTPLYIKSRKQIIIGGNEGIAYLLHAKTGKKIWEFKTGEATEEEVVRGFSRFDIKESFAYAQKQDLVVFGNAEGNLFAINRKSGEKKWSFKAEFGFLSTPLVHKNTVLASSLDKNLYCIDLDTGKELWRWNAGARIFASPVIINNKVYIGANTGRLAELNPETGKEEAFTAVPERITNKVAYNHETKRYFLPTFANEIYCLERKKDD